MTKATRQLELEINKKSKPLFKLGVQEIKNWRFREGKKRVIGWGGAVIFSLIPQDDPGQAIHNLAMKLKRSLRTNELKLPALA